MKNIFADTNDAEAQPIHEPQEPKATPHKFNMGNDKDRNEYYQLLKIKALMDNPDAIAKPVNTKEQESNILRDELGNVSGVKHSVVRGTHATGKNQANLIKALREDAYKKYDIKE